MQKLSPLMKGLVETRARVDAECIRLSSRIADLTARLDKSQVERDSCDRLITKLNNRIRVSHIEPINAWQGRYGRRGALRQAVLDVIKESYPDSLSTAEIASLLQATFNLDFVTCADRNEWCRHSVKGPLKRLARTKVIARVHDPAANTGKTGRWRWIPPDSSTSLAVQAAAAGLGTSYALDADHLEAEPPPEEDDLPR